MFVHAVFIKPTPTQGLNLVKVSSGKRPFWWERQVRGIWALLSGQMALNDCMIKCAASCFCPRATTVPFLFLRKEGLSKCGRCKQAFYCNAECQPSSAVEGYLPPLPYLVHPSQHLQKRKPTPVTLREDWLMHKLECSPMVVFGENWNPSETVRLTARILAKQKIHPERTPSEKLLAVKEFESHLDKLDSEKKDLIQSDIAALHHFYSKHLEFPDTESLVVLFAQVNCNGFTIEDEELSHLGSAIFPECSPATLTSCIQQKIGMTGYKIPISSPVSAGNVPPKTSKHYPLYSLNVASMWLKLGRLYMGLENKAAGEKALKKAIAIMEVAHGKDHPYISEIRHEIESH
ncbi:N-lysine methyltransferase SMYD2 isoform X5 [Trichechus manatus latirostris]|uniref:N-lysine methyltransferase SMYD2 isoform X5 n=1 Tax=Trichechus manatus latirostris TaxID=127582 RepID=A0A2Y9RZH0_TRIMA|nr:N-lysine methyltransferase SMYD2 isoform X5 [Trichechus manatus latirostris]